MKWRVVYSEQEDTTQPAELFEDALDNTHPKISGKLLHITDELRIYGPRIGGGYIEKCRDYQGLWEIRAIQSNTLAREFLVRWRAYSIASWLCKSNRATCIGP